MGACAALSDADKITATYRGHGWVLEADLSPASSSQRDLPSTIRLQRWAGSLTWSGGDKMSNNTEVRHAAR